MLVECQTVLWGTDCKYDAYTKNFTAYSMDISFYSHTLFSCVFIQATWLIYQTKPKPKNNDKLIPGYHYKNCEH